MTTDTALGALAAAGASACYEVSYALQTLEARRVRLYRTAQVSLVLRLARRPLWLGAIALAAAGWPLQLFAPSRAPLTLVQPIIALGVVLLLALAARMLHERIGRRELVCCAGIVLGVAGITFAAPERSDSHAGPSLRSGSRSQRSARSSQRPMWPRAEGACCRRCGWSWRRALATPGPRSGRSSSSTSCRTTHV